MGWHYLHGRSIFDTMLKRVPVLYIQTGAVVPVLTYIYRLVHEVSMGFEQKAAMSYITVSLKKGYPHWHMNHDGVNAILLPGREPSSLMRCPHKVEER